MKRSACFEAPRARQVADRSDPRRVNPADSAQLHASRALHNHRDPAVKKLAKEVLPAPASRDTVVETFRPATSLPGDATRGKTLYQKLCISCHRADGEGNALGPDFVTVRNSGREKLLLSILDPNREVQPSFIGYLIETRDGNSLLGVLASDTPAAITIREAYSKQTRHPARISSG